MILFQKLRCKSIVAMVMLLQFFTVYLVLGFSKSYASPQLLESGTWDSNDGFIHEYLLYGYTTSTPQMSWDDANSWISLNLDGYHLATITNQEEQDFIDNSIFNNKYLYAAFWAGGYQDPLTTESPNLNWTWVTGEDWSYTNWLSGEPNDAIILEQYLVINYGELREWNDEARPFNTSGFIAEKVSANEPLSNVPEPNTMLLVCVGLVGLAGLSRKQRK